MLLTYRPEAPFTEKLRFLTQILRHKDGSEQRSALRTAPRTEFSYKLLVEDGPDRATIENALFGGMALPWTIPSWPDYCVLGSAATAGQTSVTVDHSLADFRAGSSAIIYQDEYTYEVLQNITLGSGTIGFSNGLANNWPAGTEVYPLRDCLLGGNASVTRYPSNAAVYGMTMRLVDNSVNLYAGSFPSGSTLHFATMGFGTDANVLVLSDPNVMDATISETNQGGVTFIDSSTGVFSSFSYWKNGRRGSQRGFVVHNRQDLWALRVLLHGLQGRQKPFFLPVFAKDLVPLGPVTSGTNSIVVANNGFTTYVNGKSRRYLRMEFADGTHQDNLITGATVSGSQETLTFQNNWPATYAQAAITRATFYEKVRLDADDISIMHTSLNGEAAVRFPVVSVIE